jgi:hypothetical protein
MVLLISRILTGQPPTLKKRADVLKIAAEAEKLITALNFSQGSVKFIENSL